MTLAAIFACASPAHAQMAAAPPVAAPASTAPGVLGREAASALVPATVFFAGQVAGVQARNTGGARFSGGGLLLAGIVDSSGYSSGLQVRYQAYLLLDTAVLFGDRRLGPGAYGCGMVNGQWKVMDLGAHDILTLPATHDSAIHRPVPLEVLADEAPGSYRLYLGREYVRFRQAATTP